MHFQLWKNLWSAEIYITVRKTNWTNSPVSIPVRHGDTIISKGPSTNSKLVSGTWVFLYLKVSSFGAPWSSHYASNLDSTLYFWEAGLWSSLCGEWLGFPSLPFFLLIYGCQASFQFFSVWHFKSGHRFGTRDGCWHWLKIWFWEQPVDIITRATSSGFLSENYTSGLLTCSSDKHMLLPYSCKQQTQL